MSKKELGSSDVIDAVFGELKKRHATGRVVDLSDPITIAVADDSDYHRTRTGYMRYRSFTFCKFGNETWAVGRGEPYGRYPIDPYMGGDLWGFEMDPKDRSDEDVSAKIHHLKSSSRIGFHGDGVWLVGMTDGEIGSGSSHSFKESLEEGLLEHEAQRLEYRKGVIGGDLRPIPSRNQKWKPSIIEFLCDGIVEYILSQQQAEETA